MYTRCCTYDVPDNTRQTLKVSRNLILKLSVLKGKVTFMTFITLESFKQCPPFNL